MTTKKKTSKTVQKLLKDLKGTDWSVRQAAAMNPNATPQVLLLALKDEDFWVREAAKEAIDKDPFLALKIAALEDQATS